VDLSVKIYVPEVLPKSDFILQYIMRLYNNKYKCFGEPLIATIQMDSESYDSCKDTSFRTNSLDVID
jgi:hypothetical protein